MAKSPMSSLARNPMAPYWLHYFYTQQYFDINLISKKTLKLQNNENRIGSTRLKCNKLFLDYVLNI